MRVAVIDDNSSNLLLLRAALRRVGAESPSAFTDPREALEWCLANPPDLVLVDYRMPFLDGIEFVARLRASPATTETPVIMLTADDERAVRHRALEAGANDFLTKPLDLAEFVPRARNMLALGHARRLLANRAEWLDHEVKQATALLAEREREIVLRLSRASEVRDPETGSHLIRMAEYSTVLARRLGWDPARAEMMRLAAPMHDVGKVGIPDSVLLSPNRLSPQEIAIMQQHCAIGYEILRESTSPLLGLAAEIAYSHHEKWDGSGYPRRLAGADIPESGRIVALADVFDALTSERPYKKAWPVEQAVAALRADSGKHFEPRIVDAFLTGFAEILGVYREHRPPGAPGAHAPAA